MSPIAGGRHNLPAASGALEPDQVAQYSPFLDHLNLFRYLNMVLESDWHDDVDVARAVHSPHGNIHIGSPYLDPRYKI